VREEVASEAVAVFVCGGLGPTPDDRTLAALADALGRPAELSQEAQAHVQLRIDWLHGIGRIATNEMTEPNRRMALIPGGAVVLNNSIGMAPGLAIRFGTEGEEPARHVFVLPGVPREFRTIFDEEIAPHYLGYGTPHTVEEVHYDMAIEAEFWKVLRRVELEFEDLSVGSYPQPDRGHLIIRVSGTDPERVHQAAALVRAEGPGKLREA
jgi:nicotinamide-nucleotide amidase